MTDAEMAKDIVVTFLLKCKWGTPQSRAQFAERFVKACIAAPNKIGTSHLEHLAELVHAVTVKTEMATDVRRMMDKLAVQKSLKGMLGRIWAAIERAVNGGGGDDYKGPTAATGVRG